MLARHGDESGVAARRRRFVRRHCLLQFTQIFEKEHDGKGGGDLHRQNETPVRPGIAADIHLINEKDVHGQDIQVGDFLAGDGGKRDQSERPFKTGAGAEEGPSEHVIEKGRMMFCLEA